MQTVSNVKFDEVGHDFINFIAEKSRNVENPLSPTEICKEFIELSGSIISLKSLQRRFYYNRVKIHKLDNFDIETRVKMLFATSTPVDGNFLNELKEQATVDVDGENRITSYIANDGILKLKGDHSRSSKRKSQIHGELSSNEFNGEEAGFDVEDGDEDAEEENLEDKSNEPIDSSSIIPLDNNSCSSVIKTPEIQRAEPSNEVIHDDIGEPSLPNPLNIKSEATQHQNNDFINFIAEKSRDVETPMSMREICREFLEYSGSTRSLRSLEYRFKVDRHKIYEMDDFDIETKVRMLFITSTPIDSNFLNELKKQATVEVDGENRITEYIANDGILKLEGDHSRSSKHKSYYAERQKSQVQQNLSSDYFNGELDVEDDDEDVEGEKLEDNKSETQKMPTISNSKLDEVGKEFMNFIVEKSRNVETPLRPRDICKEFIEISGSTCSLGSLEQRFYKGRMKIHKMDDFDIETKVKMLFATSTPVDIGFLNELKKEATVEVDDKDRITEYIANDGNLKLKGEHSRSSKRKSQIHQQLSSNDFNGELDVEDEEEDDERGNLEDKSKESIDSPPCSSVIKTPSVQRAEPSNKVICDSPGEPSLTIPLNTKPEAIQNQTHPENGEENSNFKSSDKVDDEFMEFIVEKSENAENPLNMTQMFKEFVEISGSHRSPAFFQTRFRVYRRNIHELENFDMQTKVKILFATSTPVNFNFLNELKKEATVDVDGENRITSYIANDGLLTLRGDHGRSSKYKLFYAEKRKSQLSSNDFNGELDVEDDDEDAEGANLELDLQEPIRRSGRVSKRRFANSDYSTDENKQMSATYKKIKKEDEKSIDSLSPINNNPSSSAQRAEPHEVIYDDPGEPSRPIPLQRRVNLIDVDVELENTQMSDNNQHDEEVNMEIEDGEVVRDTRVVPFNTTRIITESSNASDDFLKPLHNVVKTLGSEMLAELERDVVNTMTRSRNANRQIPVKNMELALRTALFMTIKAAKPKEVSSENAKSLVGFLMLLNMIAFNNASLTNVQKEIQDEIKRFGDNDLILYMKSIRTVLETVLLMVTE